MKKHIIKEWLGINELQEKINRADDTAIEIIKLAHEVMKTSRENDKKHYAWTVQQEEIELVRDGKKYREIIKIIK